MMRLYALGHSGNSFKVRALLALLAVPYEEITVTLAKQEHKAPAFLQVNPRGQIPVLEDGDLRLWDSAACLTYIARRHGGEAWLPHLTPTQRPCSHRNSRCSFLFHSAHGATRLFRSTDPSASLC